MILPSISTIESENDYRASQRDVLPSAIKDRNIESLTFTKAKGGTLVLGGINNIDGVLNLNDATNNTLLTLTKDGVTFYDTSANKLMEIDGDNITFYGDQADIFFNALKNSKISASALGGMTLTAPAGLDLVGNASGIYMDSLTGFENDIYVSCDDFVLQGDLTTDASNLDVLTANGYDINIGAGNNLYLSGDNIYLTATVTDINFNSDLDMEGNDIYDVNTINANLFNGGDVSCSDLTASGSKSFDIPHPDGSDRRLKYTCPESPEVLVKHRGMGKTNEYGICEVKFPEHYTLVSNPDLLVSVQITAVGDYRMWLDSKATNKGFKAKSTHSGVSFYWEVSAVRKGYEDSPVEYSVL